MLLPGALSSSTKCCRRQTRYNGSRFQQQKSFWPLNVGGQIAIPVSVAILKEAGCEFILTPNTDISVIKAATSAGMATCIGCLTASEALTALRHGASMLKIFPAGDVGPGYIRSLRAILPSNTRLYAVGGITATNLADYLRAGCEGAGLGSDLYRAEQSQAETAEKAQRFIHAWRAWQA